MAAGDINDPLSQIPGIALADDSTDPTDLGAGYALLKFKSGQLIWLPNGGALTRALDDLTPGQVHGITEKASPVAADVLLIEDSAASWAKKRVPWSALPGGSGVSSPVDWSGTLTLTQGGALSHTVDSASYVLFGTLCWLSAELSITGSGTTNNDIIVGGVPSAAQALHPPARPLGTFAYFRAGVAHYTGFLSQESAGTLQFFRDEQAGSLGKYPDFACANGDALRFICLYRVA